MATIPLTSVLIALAGVAVGFDNLPFVGSVLGVAEIPLVLNVALRTASVALGAAVTWAPVRTIPLRNKTA